MTNSVEANARDLADASSTATTMSNPPSNPPRRRLSSRRGSLSAVDPFGVNAEAETGRATASRITIVRVPQEPQPKPRERDSAQRSSWGSNASSGSNSRAPGRLSFAFTSFNQNAGPPSPGRGISSPQISNRPPSPGGYSRSSSHHSLDRAGYPGGRPAHLTPQQICDIAVSAISHSGSSNPQEESAATPSTFLLLPDEQYLPFLDRPSEVTSLLTSPPTSRLMALLSQTFPAELRSPYDPTHPPESIGSDPSKWSFAELSKWLQTISREEADDRVWVLKTRACVLTRSELIWSRLKSALGVPPELEEEEEFDEDDTVPVDYDEEPEAFLEPIFLGDAATCVASPLATPETPFGHGSRDGVMESIGESAESEAEQEDSAETTDERIEHAIQGLRISTPMIQVLPRSRPISPVVSTRRSLSTNSAEDAAALRRRDALTMAGSGSGRVRRSAQQERGTGDPLFPSSFATLTMGPSLVANNPALRSGPRHKFRPGVQIAGRRGRYANSLTGGWDTDGNDYAISLGSGSERSFVGR